MLTAPNCRAFQLTFNICFVCAQGVGYFYVNADQMIYRQSSSSSNSMVVGLFELYPLTVIPCPDITFTIDWMFRKQSIHLSVSAIFTGVWWFLPYCKASALHYVASSHLIKCKAFMIVVCMDLIMCMYYVQLQGK